MKSILIFVDSLNEGGVSKVLLDLLENINKEKYDITVMTLYNQGVYIKEVKKYVKYKYCFDIPNSNDNSIKARIYRKYWGGMLRLPESFMYKWFVKEKYDIEIAFMHGWSTKFISGSNNKSSKKIAWVHADLVAWNRADGVFKDLEHHKKAYSKFNEIICVSKIVKEGMKNKYGIEDAKVIYNPINREKILQLTNEEISDIQLLNKFRMISIGRLSEEKGYDRLLRVFNRLKKSGYDTQLLLIGSGEKYNELNNYILENNLEKDVTLLGFKENPYKYLRECDLFVCSSISEGFSLVIGEAMAVGIPVISVKCSGPNEILEHGKYGELVNNDEDNLYIGIKNMIDNYSSKKYMDRSVKRAKMFSINKFIIEVENILDS